jgi:nucleotide-binding universal stress UspA family protein
MRALVSADGSPFSETVLEPAAYLVWALAQAAPQQGALHLLRVVDLPSAGGKFKSDAHIDTGMKEQAKHEDEAYLASLVHRLGEGDLAGLDLSTTYSVETDPDVAEAIVQKAEQENFDFIAMATHGRGGVQRWALGSITERVLHATKLPLLIMRPADNQPQSPSKSTEETESKTGDEIVVAETTEVQIESWSGLL